MVTAKRPAKVSARDRAYFEAQARSLQEAEIDTELTHDQREALRAEVNESRARHGRPPLAPGWVKTPPTRRSERAD
jgi:hypothetical protein